MNKKATRGGTKLLAVLAVSFFIPDTYSSTTEAIESIGDWTQIITPLMGLGLTYYFDDSDGRWQFIKSFGTSQLTIHGIKLLVEKRRPNYDEFSTGNMPPNSFPSGHTSSAFGGSSFIYTRYGPGWGVPAYLMAAFTGYSRVRAEKHYWDDVIAGASIATLSSLYFVDPVDDNLAVLPYMGGSGISVVMSSAVFEGDKKKQGYKKHQANVERNYYFEFFPALSRFSSNDFAKDNIGINYVDAEDEITTSAVRWSYRTDSRNLFSFFWHPFEIRATLARETEWFLFPLFTASLEYRFGPGARLIASGSRGKMDRVISEISFWKSAIRLPLAGIWESVITGMNESRLTVSPFGILSLTAALSRLVIVFDGKRNNSLYCVQVADYGRLSPLGSLTHGSFKC